MVLSKKCARKVIEEIIALFPDAKPSLNFTNHFELLVAVMLSAQTTDAAVNTVTPALLKPIQLHRKWRRLQKARLPSILLVWGFIAIRLSFEKMCSAIAG